MVININNLNNTPQVKQKLEQQVQVKQQANNNALKSEQVKTSGQDSVSLTPQAKKMSALHNKASQAPAIDHKKVAQIKKAIMAGEYKINPDKLAESIANFEFKL